MYRFIQPYLYGKLRHITNKPYPIYNVINNYSEVATNPKPFNSIPGPSSLIMMVPMLNIWPGGIFSSTMSNFDLMKTMFDQYGPLVKIGGLMGRSPMVIVLDFDLGEQILRSENVYPVRNAFESLGYYRKHVNKDKFKGVLGLLIDQGPAWKEFRSKVNVPMLHLKTIKQYAEPLEEVAAEFVECLKSIRHDQEIMRDHLSLEFNKWALESISLIALGTRLGCLKESQDDALSRKLIKTSLDIMQFAHLLDFTPNFWKLFATPNYKKAMAAYEEHSRISEHYINKAIETFKARSPDAQQGELSILEKLLAIDPKIAVVMASDMMLAGVDTAAHTMIFLLYSLATNESVQTKLREEIRSKSGQQYLKACIKESQRCHPVANATLRAASKEFVLGGYIIPEGTDMAISHDFLSNIEPNYPRAKEFLPERWLVDKEDPLHYSHAHPFSTLPFGYGVRSCIGRRIAEMEVEILLTKLIDVFEVEWTGGTPKTIQSTLNYMIPPYHFVFKDAN